jgi:hypothetical protein
LIRPSASQRDVAWDRRAIQHLLGSHYLIGRRKDA